MSNYFGPSLVDVVSGIVSILATIVLLRFWQPKTMWRFPEEAPLAEGRATLRPREALLAWMP